MKNLYNTRKKLNHFEIIGILHELEPILGIDHTFNNETIHFDYNELRLAVYLLESNDLIITVFNDHKENEHFKYDRSGDQWMQIDNEINFIAYKDINFLDSY